MKTSLKNFPDVPRQEKLDLLANFVDTKKEPLYSLVFGYQLIDGFLRGHIFSKTESYELADVRGMDQLIKNFARTFPSAPAEFIADLRRWKEERDFVIHRWLRDSDASSNLRGLEKAVQETAELGLKLFKKLRIFTTARPHVIE